MHETDKLVLNYFKKFSSFESALRISSKAGLDKSANIIWDHVKRSLKNRHFTLTDEQKVLEIIQNPPLQLKFKSDSKELSWNLGEISTQDSDLVINVLVRVRNNLFHGSKKFGDSSESDRNINLIAGALIILDSVIKSLDIDDVYNDIVDYWN